MTKQELNEKIEECLKYKENTKAITLFNELLLEALILIKEENTFKDISIDEVENTVEVHIQNFRESINSLKKYNGWSNRETWSCVLQLQSNYMINKMIADWVLQAENKKQLEAVIKNYVENIYKMASLTKNSPLNKMVEDIGVLKNINFGEIASSFSIEK